MTVPSYTKEDVELVRAAVVKALAKPGELSLGRTVLDALASAGRLVPNRPGETAECGCPIRYAVMRIEEETKECSTRKAAERMAKCIDEEYGDD